MTFLPNVEWAQDKSHVFIKIDVQDCADSVIKPSADSLAFKGTSNGKQFAFNLELQGQVEPDSWKSNITNRSIQLLATKVDKTSFWPRLPKDASKHRWIKVDFSKFVDEDEEAELPLENPDFLKMMSGMPGMPGMPPHDSDDEEEEEQ